MKLEERIKRQEVAKEKNRKIFVEGMKRYEALGVRVLIDGKVADDAGWDRVFEEPKKNGDRFYMADYVFEESPEYGEEEQDDEDYWPSKSDREGTTEREDKFGQGNSFGGNAQIRETPPKYGREWRLKEIRFDRVYNK